MKKRLKAFYLASALIVLGLAWMGCSNDEPSDVLVDTPSETPDEDETVGGITIPKDVLEKVKGIYSKASTNPQKVTTVQQLAVLTSICAARQVKGPIAVTPCLLNGEAITLVTLGGTEDKKGQATTIKESQLAAFGKPNDYLTAVSSLFATNVVPKEKPVLIAGISLGGMIAQQLIADSLVSADYQLKAVITFGSPLTMPIERRGVKVVRFADVHDKVPQLGEMVIRMGMVSTGLNKEELAETLNMLDKKEKIVRTSQYTEMIETHALSYIDEPCWNDVDFMGNRGKKNVLELQSSLKFYPAPQLDTK